MSGSAPSTTRPGEVLRVGHKLADETLVHLATVPKSVLGGTHRLILTTLAQWGHDKPRPYLKVVPEKLSAHLAPVEEGQPIPAGFSWHSAEDLAAVTGLSVKGLSNALGVMAKAGYEVRHQIGVDARGNPLYSISGKRRETFQLPLARIRGVLIPDPGSTSPTTPRIRGVVDPDSGSTHPGFGNPKQNSTSKNPKSSSTSNPTKRRGAAPEVTDSLVTPAHASEDSAEPHAPAGPGLGLNDEEANDGGEGVSEMWPGFKAADGEELPTHRYPPPADVAAQLRRLGYVDSHADLEWNLAVRDEYGDEGRARRRIDDLPLYEPEF